MIAAFAGIVNANRFDYQPSQGCFMEYAILGFGIPWIKRYYRFSQSSSQCPE